MNRREWYLLAALVALLIFPTRALAQQRPNVLLILVDDLNHFVGRGGNYSQAKTPFIDRLAQTGVQFLKAHANYPVCNPSRVSLFHDLYPWAAKIMFWETWYQEPVSQNNQTLMQLLRENGYTTDGTGKLMHKERPDQFDVHQLSGPNYVPSLYDPSAPGEEKKTAHPDVPEPYRSTPEVPERSYGPNFDLSKVGDGISKWTYKDDQSRVFHYQNDGDRDLTLDEQN